jgi:2-methylcitrate dehydratase PrpD
VSTAAEHLGDLTALLGSAPLPEAAQAAATRAFVDWFGVTLAGGQEKPARVLAEALASPAATAGLVGQQARADWASAALINGTAAHTLELDDIYAPGLFHPGAPVIAAALAVAEHVHAPGERFLRAVCAGYEVGGRVSADLGPGHYVHWHTTGTAGALGAAAAAALLVGCDARESAHALALAATMAAGLQQTFRRGAIGKPLHAGHAAHAGVVAALSARGGITGALNALDGEVGLAAATDGGPEWTRSRSGPAPRLVVEHTTVKPYPCCGHTFAPVDAVLELVARGLRPDDVADVEVRTYAAALEVAGIRDPLTAAEARFSIPYAVATAIATGKIARDSFTDRPRTSGTVLALMRRVTMIADEEFDRAFPARRGARVRVTTHAGGTLAAVVPDRSGSPQNPLSDARIEDKFLGLAAVTGGREHAVSLLERARRIGAVDDLTSIHQRPAGSMTIGGRSP